MNNTPQTTIELFHLLFLQQLGGKLDKKLYSLKGGCNLRFFFKSIRYSEDIDFDITQIGVETLKNKVNKIIESISFQRILQSRRIEIVQVNPAKQTTTTQRWKLLLQVPQSSIQIPTKVEFSRRSIAKGTLYESIDPDVISQYHLYPILCSHYDRETAFLQKIDALINRTETQARDIFDLKLLLDQGVDLNQLKSFSREKLLAAIKNAKQISYSDYKGQVVVFLMNDYMNFYNSNKKWDDIQYAVVSALKDACK